MRSFKSFIKETGRYILAGTAAAAVNLATFFICSKALSINYLISNGLAWLLTVIVSFTLDKKYVFKTLHSGKKELFKFAASRLLSLFIDQLMIWILVAFVGFDSSLAKIVDSALVVVINYIMSRKIFKKTDKKEDKK